MTLVFQFLLLLVLLQTKHLIIDWCLQPAYEWQNKGIYGHWGGVRHALKNAIGTGLCFIFFTDLTSVFGIIIIDYILHYHIDWTKMNINRIKKWGPLTHDNFWRLVGLDQWCHQITYIFLIWLFLV